MSRAGFEESLAKWEDKVRKENTAINQHVIEYKFIVTELEKFHTAEDFEEKVTRAYDYFYVNKLTRAEFLNLILKWCSEIRGHETS